MSATLRATPADRFQISTEERFDVAERLNDAGAALASAVSPALSKVEKFLDDGSKARIYHVGMKSERALQSARVATATKADQIASASLKLADKAKSSHEALSAQGTSAFQKLVGHCRDIRQAARTAVSDAVKADFKRHPASPRVEPYVSMASRISSVADVSRAVSFERDLRLRERMTGSVDTSARTRSGFSGHVAIEALLQKERDRARFKRERVSPLSYAKSQLPAFKTWAQNFAESALNGVRSGLNAMSKAASKLGAAYHHGSIAMYVGATGAAQKIAANRYAKTGVCLAAVGAAAMWFGGNHVHIPDANSIMAQLDTSHIDLKESFESAYAALSSDQAFKMVSEQGHGVVKGLSDALGHVTDPQAVQFVDASSMTDLPLPPLPPHHEVATTLTNGDVHHAVVKAAGNTAVGVDQSHLATKAVKTAHTAVQTQPHHAPGFNADALNDAEAERLHLITAGHSAALDEARDAVAKSAAKLDQILSTTVGKVSSTPLPAPSPEALAKANAIQDTTSHMSWKSGINIGFRG